MERDREEIFEEIIKKKGWITDPHSKDRNVYRQEPMRKEEKLLLKNKRPDYILYDSESLKPLAIVEMKDTNKNLEKAIDQAREYAKCIGVNIIFASDGNFLKSEFIIDSQPLMLNGSIINSIDNFPSEDILTFFKTSSNIITVPEDIIRSKYDLIFIFNKVNEILRKEGIMVGNQRLMVFSTILFYKMISERKDFEKIWLSIKNAVNLKINLPFQLVKPEIESYYGKNSVFDINISHENLKLIIDEIDYLKFSNIKSDIKGDAFEFFLKSSRL